METENTAETTNITNNTEAHAPPTENTLNENTDEESEDPVIKEIKPKPQSNKDPKIKAKKEISAQKQAALAKARLGKANRAKERKEVFNKLILECDSDEATEYVITRRKIQKPAQTPAETPVTPDAPRKPKRPATPSPEPERSPSPPLRPKLRFV